MLDLFLAFIDRFIQLAESKDRRRKTYFTEVYKPLMSELEKIHLDYVSTFYLCLSFANHNDFIQMVIDTIEVKRVPLLPARIKLREYARTIYENRHYLSKVEEEFSSAMLGYFGLGIPYPYQPESSNTRISGIMRRLNEELPVETEAELRAFFELKRSEPTFSRSYAKVKYITDVRNIDAKNTQEFAISILKSEIESLNSRWAKVCSSYSEIEFSIAHL